jgi:hypothetical protein
MQEILTKKATPVGKKTIQSISNRYCCVIKKIAPDYWDK